MERLTFGDDSAERDAGGLVGVALRTILGGSSVRGALGSSWTLVVLLNPKENFGIRDLPSVAIFFSLASVCVCVWVGGWVSLCVCMG